MEAMSVFSKVSQFRLEDRKQQAEEAIEDVAANATPPEEIVREVVEETIENEEPVKEAEALLAEVYQEIDRIIAHVGNLDAKFLMLLKSHIGPIENYMSPKLIHHIFNQKSE